MDRALLLEHTATLPEVTLDVGEALVREGERGDSLWILVSGRLEVARHGVVVNVVDEPGSAIGEISLLLDTTYSTTVTASEPTVVRHARDGRALLLGDPVVVRMVAVGLAERLAFVTTYLADLKNQYGDAPGVAMVSDVLSHLAHHHVPPAKPGSARDPDPDY